VDEHPSLAGQLQVRDIINKKIIIHNNICILPFRIIVMGTAEKLGVNIHVDQLMDTIASNCGNLERLELRWDPDNLRFSDKSQKAIDILRVKCLKLRCMVLRWVSFN